MLLVIAGWHIKAHDHTINSILTIMIRLTFHLNVIETKIFKLSCRPNTIMR